MRGGRERQAGPCRFGPQHQKIKPLITFQVPLEPVHDLLTARDRGAPVDQVNTGEAELPFHELDEPVLHFDMLNEDQRPFASQADPAQDVHRGLEPGGHADIGLVLRRRGGVRMNGDGPDVVQHLQRAATGARGELTTGRLVSDRLRFRHKPGMQPARFFRQIARHLLFEASQGDRRQPLLPLEHEGVKLAHDPDHPNIDYTLAPFEQAHNEGDQISGWWVINEQRAAIDDSPTVVAINYSAYEARSFGGLTALFAQCREGTTSIVFVQDDYLISASRRGSFDITYRIDSAPAQSTRWSELTNNKGAGLFGTGSEDFLRSLYNAENFFIRLTDGNGQSHDAEFDLAGIQDTTEAVAGACGWSTLDLSRDDYRAIQTLLNAGGFDAGTPDGVWGKGSRDAMRMFQEQNGLPTTGAPDRATLKALGVQSGE